MSLVPVLTPAEAAAWDRAAETEGRTIPMLMQGAGRAVAQLLLDRYPEATMRGVLIAAGPGNNGGDGWVTAESLQMLEIPVWVVPVGECRPGPALEARRRAESLGVRTLSPDGPWPGVGILVDALLGTGAVGAPRAPMAAMMSRLMDLRLPIVAIDGITGLDLANGVHHGESRADLSITFGGARRGHLLARDESGALIVAEIGLGRCRLNTPQLISASWAAGQLRSFPAKAHKGVRGRVVVIGGVPAMLGAARLACHGALNAGAGLLHLVTAEDSLAEARIAEPEIQVTAADFASPPDRILSKLLEEADVVVIGPGLGRNPSSVGLVLGAIEKTSRAVVDADALHLLASARDSLGQLARTREILATPHLGEFRKLFPEWSEIAAMAPWDAARCASGKSGITVLLKGVPTVIAAGEQCLTVAAGNPGQATGGSGDLLAGVAGTLLAQGCSALVAGAVATQGLGDAADLSAQELGTRAMRPHDVLRNLPEVWQSWRADVRRVRPYPVLWECSPIRE